MGVALNADHKLATDTMRFQKASQEQGLLAVLAVHVPETCHTSGDTADKGSEHSHTNEKPYTCKRPTRVI